MKKSHKKNQHLSKRFKRRYKNNSVARLTNKYTFLQTPKYLNIKNIEFFMIKIQFEILQEYTKNLQ